jgi:hypothetical protein
MALVILLPLLSLSVVMAVPPRANRKLVGERVVVVPAVGELAPEHLTGPARVGATPAPA